MTDVADTSQVPQDRSTRLFVCGILVVLVGVCCLALVPLMLLLTQMAPEEVHGASIGLSVVFYGLMGLAAIAIGIGSIRCARWARDLILAGASLWLALGVPTCIFSCWIMSDTMHSSMSMAGAQVSSAMM